MLKWKGSKSREVNMKSGIVIVNKESGLTSQAVVNRVKRIFGVDKAGHTGTLDPMAVGVLPVLIGRAVKASEFMLTSDKHYKATLTLGLTTDTEDITGKILTRSDREVEEEEVRRAVASFVGEYMQTPPMYSALKIGGKKLCDLARGGVTVEREARRVTIHSIGVERIDEVNYTLDVRCSKGTYIRTLCADIGAALGCGGTMATLRRTASGGFSLDNALTVEQLEAMSPDERRARLIPLESLFATLPALKLGEFHERLIRGGCAVAARKLGVRQPIGTRLQLCGRDGFFALGEIVEAEGEPAVKMVKLFTL